MQLASGPFYHILAATVCSVTADVEINLNFYTNMNSFVLDCDDGSEYKFYFGMGLKIMVAVNYMYSTFSV